MEKPNPYQSRAFFQTCHLLDERPSGDQPQGAAWKTSGRGPTERIMRPGRGRRGRSSRGATGSGLSPGPWCSRRQFLGLYPLQCSIKRSRMCRPRMCRLLASFFFNDAFGMSTCPRKVRGGRLDQGRKRPNPWRNRTFLQTCPLLGEGLSGDNPKGASGKVPGKCPTERIQGVSGPAAGASGTGAPENQWGRVNSKPHVPHWASFCGISRPGVRLRCQQREIGAVVFTCFRFFRGCTWKVQMAN